MMMTVRQKLNNRHDNDLHSDLFGLSITDPNNYNLDAIGDFFINFHPQFSYRFQRLFQIFQKVFRIFNSGGEAHEVIPGPPPVPLAFRESTVRLFRWTTAP